MIYSIITNILYFNFKTTNLGLPPPIRDEGEEEDLPRRRGRQRKKGKKSGRDSSAGIEKEVKGLAEPWDTQVGIYVGHTISKHSNTKLFV